MDMSSVKTFSEWMAENHPEELDEGLRDLANSRIARNLVAGAALTAGGLGIGSRMMASSPQKPAATTQEDQDDEDFIAGDVDPDVEIAQEKAKMLRDASKLRHTTKLDANKGIVTSRGSGSMSGGKVVPSQGSIRKATQAPLRKFDPKGAKLPVLPGGAGQSRDLGSAE
jgi:hypothetical protein